MLGEPQAPPCFWISRAARARAIAKSVLALAVRWALDAPDVSAASWGGRSPEQLEPLDEVVGWPLDGETKRTIDEILRKVMTDPIGPEFMAPPPRASTARADARNGGKLTNS